MPQVTPMQPRLPLALALFGALWLAMAPLALGAAPTLEGASSLRIKVTARGPAQAPFEEVSYTLRVERGHATIAASKSAPGRFGLQDRMGMVEPDVLRLALARLDGCDLTSLPSRPTRARSSWRFEVTVGKVARKVELGNPEKVNDPRYMACMEAIRGLADEVLGPMPLLATFKPGDPVGFLRADSHPQARIFIDGLDTGLEGPVSAVPLPPGQHEVTFVAEGQNLKRTYTVTIMDDMTTNLEVDLR